MFVQLAKTLGVLSLLASTVQIATADDYVANNCEVFIDRAQTVVGSHASMTSYFWVKTLNDRLDGKIVRVGARVHQVGMEEGRTYLDHYYEIAMTPYFGATDYFELNGFGGTTSENEINPLWVGTALEFTWNERVQVYVQTDKGSRYFAKTTDGDRTYKFDGNLGENLRRVRGGMPDFSENQSTAVITATSFPYLNPDQCQ